MFNFIKFAFYTKELFRLCIYRLTIPPTKAYNVIFCCNLQTEGKGMNLLIFPSSLNMHTVKRPKQNVSLFYGQTMD